jgi:hypothetical protein
VGANRHFPCTVGFGAALGAPWLGAAFALCAVLRRMAVAAAGGALLLSVGTLTYYLGAALRRDALRRPAGRLTSCPP